MPMEIDETVKGHSNFVIGILIVSVASILVAVALGIWGTQIITHDQSEPLGLGLSSSVEKSTPEFDTAETDNLVSVAMGDCIEMDTEAGKIEVFNANLPDWEVLPLCITNDMLADYFVTLRVTGGYTPECGSIKFYQKDVLQGEIDITFTHERHEPCYADYWSATFSTGSDIELESNQWPEYPEGLTFSSNYDIEVEKKVTVCLCTKWTGCHFWLILTQ